MTSNDDNDNEDLLKELELIYEADAENEARLLTYLLKGCNPDIQKGPTYDLLYEWVLTGLDEDGMLELGKKIAKTSEKDKGIVH